MLKRKIYLESSFKWAPGMDDAAWKRWAGGAARIPFSEEHPPMEYLSAKSLRRMNQMTRMTIHALHAMLPLAEDSALFFISSIGEADQQFALEREYRVEKEIHPATFSYSVFNAPIAMATILLKQDRPYSCMFGSHNEVKSGFLTAIAPLVSGRRNEVVVIVCEEAIPAEYVAIHQEGGNEPFVYALKLTSRATERELDAGFLDSLTTEEELLKTLVGKGWV